MTSAERAAMPAKDLVKIYSVPGALVTGTLVWLTVTARGAAPALPESLVPPMIAMFWVTCAVWLAMVLARNVAVIRGSASIRYYEDYHSDVPDERIERPARAFNNLMQVPALFYVVCVLMLVTKRVDAAQVSLAWTFVAFRVLHALVYMVVNLVPYRFALWVSAFITLCVMWYRFGAASL